MFVPFGRQCAKGVPVMRVHSALSADHGSCTAVQWLYYSLLCTLYRFHEAAGERGVTNQFLSFA
jgi:hypothetical protein